MTKEAMLEKLMELDFIALDLSLYLNTHPNNKAAIKAYNEAVMAGSTLREKYEAEFGGLCSFRSYCDNTNKWDWKNNPWPWQAKANPSLADKECV